MTQNQKRPWHVPVSLTRKEKRIVYCTVENFGGTKILCAKPPKSRKKRRGRRVDVPRDLKGVSVGQILLHDYWCDVTLMAHYYGVLGSSQSAFDDL